ncbi:MAG TPA: hypothetical protein VFP00_10225, partial [Burkholderiales bacterium]|nr:hypothetical protein [Burkholderiales bacterium]
MPFTYDSIQGMSRSSHPFPPSPSRRRFLLAAGSTLAAYAAVLPSSTAATTEYRLSAGRARARLVPDSYPETDIWSYNGSAPG